MTLQDIMEIKQKLLSEFKRRVEEGLTNFDIYDFPRFIQEPVSDPQINKILGNFLGVKYYLQEKADKAIAYSINENSTLTDWTSIVMLNLLKLLYKAQIPQSFIMAHNSFDMLSFMFFGISDSMIISSLTKGSRLKTYNVRMMTVAEVNNNKIEFERCLANGSIMLYDIDAKNEDNRFIKINFNSLSLPVLVSPTSGDGFEISIIYDGTALGEGVEAQIKMYSPLSYLEILTEGIRAFTTQVPAVCKFSHIKSDLSIRTLLTSMNPKVLNTMWEDESRVAKALEWSKNYTSKGYIQIPDIDTPQNDDTNTRALNLLRIVDFGIEKKGLGAIKKKASINYKDARFVLQLLIINNSKDGKLPHLIYKTLVQKGIINEGVDILPIDSPVEQFNKVMEIFFDPSNSSASFDKLCFDALTKLTGKDAEIIMDEFRPIKIKERRDVTADYKSYPNKLAWLITTAKSNILEVSYKTKGGFNEIHYLTRSEEIVASIYGADWKTTGKNYLLGARKINIEATIDFLKKCSQLSILKSIAQENKLEVRGNTVEEIRQNMIDDLTTTLSDIVAKIDRYSNYNRDNSGLLFAFSLDVNKALMKINPDKFNLMRYFTVDNIESVAIITNQ